MANRVFITGATGLLGRTVVSSFLAEGWEISALVRPASKYRTKPIPNHHSIHWIEGDILDVEVLVKAIAEVDYVIHAGALVSFNPADRDRLFETNVTGTANVVNACLLNPNLKKLLHVSSVATLSPGRPLPAQVNEKQGFNPDATTSDYASSKYLAELEVIRGKEEGLKAVMINPSIVLAPGNSTESSAGIFQYVKNEIPFYPTGWINYVDARDVARAITRLITDEHVSAERFILNAGTTPYQDFLASAAQMFKVRPPYIRAGKGWAGIAWRVDELVSFLTGKKPFITRFTAAASSKCIEYQNLALLEKWPDFRYQTLSETLRWVATNT